MQFKQSELIILSIPGDISQIMERCGVCSEMAYLLHCAHCEEKVCEDCKRAHMDILRHEITIFNSEIRRSLHSLQDALAIIEKNTHNLQTNCNSASDEIEEIYRRVTKAIKDRSDQLKGEIGRYVPTEMRNLTSLKENLDLEITNIVSNCDVVDKYMNETVKWDDCELMDIKEILLKTVDFLWQFENENSEQSRRAHILVAIEPNQLVVNFANDGDLNIDSNEVNAAASSSHLATSLVLQSSPLVSYNYEPVLGGCKFIERPIHSATDRYGDRSSGNCYERDYDKEQSLRSNAAKSCLRKRVRFDSSANSYQNVHSNTEQQQQLQNEARLLENEDLIRDQLSNIIRLSDCAQVTQSLTNIGKEKKSDNASSEENEDDESEYMDDGENDGEGEGEAGAEGGGEGEEEEEEEEAEEEQGASEEEEPEEAEEEDLACEEEGKRPEGGSEDEDEETGVETNDSDDEPAKNDNVVNVVLEMAKNDSEEKQKPGLTPILDEICRASNTRLKENEKENKSDSDETTSDEETTDEEETTEEEESTEDDDEI